jgi:branched-chain amino acid transport system permease protein
MKAGHYHESYEQQVALLDLPVERVWTVILVALLAIYPLVATTYWLTIATGILIACIGTVGLNIMVGVTGLISLGHAGFLALGAYTAVIVATKLGVTMPLAVIAGGMVSGGASLLVGAPSLRLKGLYLAITTLAFSVIITHVILKLDFLTRGSAGLFAPAPEFLGLLLTDRTHFYWFVLVVTVLFILMAGNLMRSRTGRAFSAIRDQDIAAQSMGIPLAGYKLRAFFISAFFTGVSGALLAYHVRYINVDSFTLIASIEALSMIIVGGLGTISGAVMGTVFIALLPEAVRELFELFGSGLVQLFSTRVMEVKSFLYGLAIILFLRFQPDGLRGAWREVRRYWSNWPFMY